MIEYKKHYRHWKAIQDAFPDLSLEEVKDHANGFFNKVNSIRPHRVSMLDFIRKNSIDYFKSITFDKPIHRQVGEDKKNSEDKDPDNSIHTLLKNQSIDPFEEEKRPQEDKRSEEFKQSVEEVKVNQVRENHREAQNRRYIPTQSKVMTDALKISTTEMMKLMQNLVRDLQIHREEIQRFPSAAGYWGYIYNSAVYLQQIVNDVTVAHNSTLTFMQESKVCYSQSDSIT
jgi:hypothetical protein